MSPNWVSGFKPGGLEGVPITTNLVYTHLTPKRVPPPLSTTITTFTLKPLSRGGQAVLGQVGVLLGRQQRVCQERPRPAPARLQFHTTTFSPTQFCNFTNTRG